MEIDQNIEARVSKRPRRKLRVSRPVPAPSIDEPSDDELLRFLDGAMAADERAAFELRLRKSPYAAARIELLAAALEENGWPIPDGSSGRGSA
jgi:hypothetical protein